MRDDESFERMASRLEELRLLRLEVLIYAPPMGLRRNEMATFKVGDRTFAFGKEARELGLTPRREREITDGELAAITSALVEHDGAAVLNARCPWPLVEVLGSQCEVVRYKGQTIEILPLKETVENTTPGPISVVEPDPMTATPPDDITGPNAVVTDPLDPPDESTGPFNVGPIEGAEMPPSEAPKAQIIDLMEALKASLEAGGEKGERKPAKRAKSSSSKSARKKAGGASG